MKRWIGNRYFDYPLLEDCITLNQFASNYRDRYDMELEEVDKEVKKDLNHLNI